MPPWHSGYAPCVEGDHRAQCVVVGSALHLLQPVSASLPFHAGLGECRGKKTFHSISCPFLYPFCKRHPNVVRTPDRERTRSILSRGRGCRDRVTWRKAKAASVVSSNPTGPMDIGGYQQKLTQQGDKRGDCSIKSTPSPVWCPGPQKETLLTPSLGSATSLGCDLRGVMSSTLG